MCGSGYSRCITNVLYPSNGINNGVEIDERVEITCQCGLLQPGRWYLNVTEINSSRDSVPYVRFTTLVIPNFVPQYVGNYTCESRNDRRNSTVIELYVSKQCKQLSLDVVTLGTMVVSFKLKGIYGHALVIPL